MAIATNYYPETYYPGFAYFPVFLKSKLVTYNLSNFTIEMDLTGRSSIIHLVDSNGIKASPFIDFGKFDAEIKDWYWYDTVDNLPYRYRLGNMTNVYPCTIGTLAQAHIYPMQYSDVSGVWAQVRGYNDPLVTGKPYPFIKYTPIILAGNNVPFKDLSDYVNLTTNNNLDQYTPNPQFYYDFQDRIYTNVNLASYDSNSFQIKMYSIGTNQVSLKCSLGTNSNGQPKSTPVIKDYIVKLKGQYLGS